VFIKNVTVPLQEVELVGTSSSNIKAIQAGNYKTWPTITGTNIHKHFLEPNETQKGHMKRQCQGTRSTKTLKSIVEDEEEEPIPELGTHTQTPENTTNQTNLITPKQPKAKIMKVIYIKIHNASDTMHTIYIKIRNASDTMHTDQLGHFPATSSAGNKYIISLDKVN
jgi:hypothetical protein